MNIVIVEDEQTDFILIKYAIEQLATPYSVLHAETLSEAMDAIKSTRVHLAVVDILLPDGDGFKLSEHLKDQSIPYVMVSSRSMPVDAIQGLKSGAEDYIRKPFDVDELAARLERILARHNMPISQPLVRHEGVRQTLSHHGIPLTPTEEQLLSYLSKEEECYVSTNDLIQVVWGNQNRETSKGALRTYISHIRKKLEQCDTPYAIISKWGCGYRLTRAEADARDDLAVP